MGYLDKNGVTYLWSKIKSIFATKEYVDNAIENAPSGGGGVGESTTGKVYVIDKQEVTADVGAEIFNDYTNNIATGQYAHAEGYKTTAKGNYSHVEGNNTKATANSSHAEGQNTTASGVRAHAEGYGTTARSNDSHAEGFNTTSASSYQHVQGRYNIVDSSGTYAHIVGNGANGALSNAHTIDWSGNGWFQGNVYIGGTKQSEGKQLATQEYVEEALGNIPSGVTSWNDLTDKPTIPTKTSQLTNDSGFITLNDIPSGGGSGGVTSWNDLTDKPFGEEFSEILPPTEVIMEDTSGGVVFDAIEGIEDNKTYIVGYNNVNYECIAKAITEDGITVYMIGNLSMLGMEDNGYPFLLMIVSPSQVADVGVGAMVYAFDSPSSITLSIAGEKIIPIDIKYLPESLQFGSEITTSGEIMSERELVKVSAGEFLAMDDSGETPFIFPELIAGSTYTIVFNGATYNTLGVLLEGAGISGIGLGNLGALGMGDITDDPFACAILNSPEFGGNVMVCVPIDGSTTVTASLSGEFKTVKKMESIYLPEPIIFTTTNLENFTCNKTYEECRYALENNFFNAYVVVNNSEGKTVASISIMSLRQEDMVFALMFGETQISIVYAIDDIYVMQ